MLCRILILLTHYSPLAQHVVDQMTLQEYMMTKTFGQMLGFRPRTEYRPVPVPLPAPQSTPNPDPLPHEFWQFGEALASHPIGARYDLVMDTYFQARHYVCIAGSNGPIHEHTFRLQINCSHSQLHNDEHVTIGYREVRAVLIRTVSAYDGCLLNDLPPFQYVQPTAEVLSHLLYLQVRAMLQPKGVKLVKVTLWESPTVSISYSEADGSE
jgi:6-pyruvoyltetrahydropterin/6-carboxytetrahydropterin synthase